jgi:hypothetical protein
VRKRHADGFETFHLDFLKEVCCKPADAGQLSQAVLD